MALPILGVAAQAIMRSGAPAALAKYGAKAVKAAKEEIKNRTKKIDDMATKQRVKRTGNKQGRPSEAQLKQKEISRNADELSSFNKGGKVRGVGIATQGVRAAKLR